MALFKIVYKMQEDIGDYMDEYLLDDSSSIFAILGRLKRTIRASQCKMDPRGNIFLNYLDN